MLETGKKFDSNVDTTFGHAQPLQFVIGSGQTIRAWEEGFQFFGKGGKGTLYVPSLMGYGPPGKPPVIPAYAPLIFEVEVKCKNPVCFKQDGIFVFIFFNEFQ